IDLLFNTSQMILSAAAAAIIYRGVLTTGPLADGAGAVVAAIVAAAAMYVTTTTLVVIAVAMMSGRSPVQVWLEAAAVEWKLTAEECAIMKLHPATGAEILAKFPEYRRGRELVLAHHERIDGRGYPRGLAGDAIPLGARVIAVSDSWDAMTSNRPYRTALDPHVAMAELLRGRG